MINRERKNTLLYYFSYILINDILPFEAKYISLRKFKNFTFVRYIIKFYLEEIFKYSYKELTIEEFNENYGKKLEKSLQSYKIEYITLLIKSHEEILKPYKSNIEQYFEKNNNNVSIKLEYIDSLIEFLETKLNIENSLIKEYQLNIPMIDKHVNSNIYSSDLNLLKNKIKKFHKYYKILEEILYKKGFIQKIDNNIVKPVDKISNLEYLYFVVMHEFWNFLSHFSMGFVYFNSPNNFLSNLNKSISHLKRAIMDLLDGMIIEYDCTKKSEYLKLRVMKVASLGNKSKIQELIKNLEDLFDSCIKQTSF
ncbi:hypothetical protein FE773_04780 [Caminibacter mediatlanticus TB-2]|uniref:Uncharacterized protein n=1 Tax=Caminibacter mediatlanticus TB-2 TaxID=391592 RepID=A0ABX5VBM6_9BACT|nr:hypothetical protein [Caminibacter mediatlanticus]QCT94515.1 hypothetical protein FE773_04780 [Caminibacter mediatlanticus TB-2]